MWAADDDNVHDDYDDDDDFGDDYDDHEEGRFSPTNCVIILAHESRYLY